MQLSQLENLIIQRFKSVLFPREAVTAVYSWLLGCLLASAAPSMFERREGSAPPEPSFQQPCCADTDTSVASTGARDIMPHQDSDSEDSQSILVYIEDEGARVKLEHEASYLIRQIDAIERNNQDLRSQTKALEVDSHDVSETTTAKIRHGTSHLHTPKSVRTRAGRVNPSPLTPNPSSALADDLSTINEDSTPVKRRLQELEEENGRLRESLLRCNKAVLEIKKNADLKVVRLEWEVARLRQQLADESAVNIKCICLNQSLRRQLQHVADQIVKRKNDGPSFRQRYEDLRDLHQRELVVERNMNELIQSRSQAIRDNTALKKLLLSTCFECRQRLPVQRRMSEPNIDTLSPNEDNGDEDEPPTNNQHFKHDDVGNTPVPTASVVARELEHKPAVSRPTYQTSARNVLDNLPKQPVAPKSQSPERNNPCSPMSRPKKSCLKASNSTSPTPTTSKDKYILRNGSGRSPTTTTTLLIDPQPSSTRRSLMPLRILHSERNLSPSLVYENRRGKLAESAATSSLSQQQQQAQRANPGNSFRRRPVDAVTEPTTRRASTGTLIVGRRPSSSLKRVESTSGGRGPSSSKDKQRSGNAKQSSQSRHIGIPLRQPVAIHRVEF